MKYIYILFILICVSSLGVTQPPSPAPAQKDPIALTGATIHVGNGTVIENGLIAFDQGKITYVGPQSQSEIDLSTHKVNDVKGQHIYPGLILLNTSLGLIEISAVRASVDARETGQF